MTAPRDTHRFDVVIVGGGLLGAACAYYLSKAGTRVLLLERGALNRQASGQNAGSLHFQLEYRAIEHGEEMARHHALQIPLLQDAQQRWAGLEQELGAPLEIHQEGGLMVAETASEVQTLKQKAALERSFGLEGHLLTGDEARAIAPALSPSIQAALFSPKEGKANPRLVGPTYARAAIQRGAVLRTEARVTAIERRNGCYVVQTADGQAFMAEAVINAAGIWMQEIAAMVGVQIPIVPVALQMNCTEPTRPLLRHLVQHVGRRLSMKQMQDGQILIGGGWPSRMVIREGMIEKSASPGISYESLQGNLAAATGVVPAVAGLHLIRTWTGMTALTVDQVPMLGEVARSPGFFMVGGGSAFTLGPTYAKYLSDLILTGRTEVDLHLYSPARFAHLTF